MQVDGLFQVVVALKNMMLECYINHEVTINDIPSNNAEQCASATTTTIESHEARNQAFVEPEPAEQGTSSHRYNLRS